jgi:RNA polymerase sigma factor (sigma-70 family)
MQGPSPPDDRPDPPDSPLAASAEAPGDAPPSGAQPEALGGASRADVPANAGTNNAGEPLSSNPAESAVRRYLVEEVLISAQLRGAIEAHLRSRRHSYRWNELLAEAEEIRNEVALRALDHLSTFDPQRCRPLPWLMGIAVNVLRERSRWNRRESDRAVGQSSYTEEQWKAVVSRLSVEPRLVDEPCPVWQALAQVPPEQQRVLRLRFVEDRTYAVIAQALGISEEATRARVCRALRALRCQLTSQKTRNEEARQ